MAGNQHQYWYIATLVIASKAGADEVQTCEEQIRAIRAPNAESAYEKALIVGKNEEHSYLNVYGQTVTWAFVGLENLEVVDDSMRDGVEIRSRLFGHKTPSKLVRSKAELSVFASENNPHNSEYKFKTENIPATDS